jgi:hypothetical protein
MTKLEEIQNEYAEAMNQYYKEKSKSENAWKKKLKGLINVSGLFRDLSEMDNYEIIDIVEVYNVEEKSGGYPDHQHGKIKGEKISHLYMKQNATELRGIDHVFVWQTVGMCGDDYSGYCLYPLKNGLYLKTSYSC